MNLFERFVYWLQGTMETPVPYGWFHLMWIALVIIAIIILYKIKDKYNDRQLKTVLLVYGIIAFVLEALKQISWAFNFDPITNLVTWDYEWYAFPFQLCTTPIFVSLICAFLKEGKVRTSLLSYMAFVTILGSLATIIIPDSCFVSDILVNIHTMWLHCGSLVVSVYLLMTSIKINKKNLINSLIVFLVFVGLALFFNILVYNIGVLNGETFNMFYISPYFISSLPVFDVLQETFPYLIYLVMYISIISLGAIIVYYISYFIKNILSRKTIF